MARIAQPTPGMPGGPNISYGYDADGRRVSQTVGSTTTTYLWDEFSTYGDVVYETNGTQTISYVLGYDRLISQCVNSTTSYFLQDGQGSTRALTGVTGNVTDTYDYTAFGELYAQTGTTPNLYLYTSQRFDAATDQYYLRAREYDPVVGRFLSRDKATSNFYPQNPSDQCSGYPLVGACGLGALNGSSTTAFNELNRYVYVANNPINLIDPTGYMAGETALDLFMRGFVSAPPLYILGGDVYINILIVSYLLYFVSEVAHWVERIKTTDGDTIEGVRELQPKEVKARGLEREKQKRNHKATDTIYIDREGNLWIGRKGGPVEPW